MTQTPDELANLEETLPRASVWRHRNGTAYEIVAVANTLHGKQDRYPMTVVYENIENGNVFARRATDWHRSMTRID